MKYLSLLIILLLIFCYCHIDHGLEPIRSSINGVISYKGQWPATVTEIRLVAANKFPPSSINDLIIGDSLPLTGDRFEYAFYLDPGIYKVMGVAWREEGSIWDIASICGLYFSGTDSLSPGAVIIENERTIVDSINITVNRSSAHRITNTKIIGSIKFTGTWPDSLIDVRVIATTKFSLIPTILPTLLDISFGQSIPVGTDSTDYVINAYPGKYVATGVLFFKANTSLSVEDIFYSGSVGGLNLNQYDVIENATIQGPNFNIKFSQ